MPCCVRMHLYLSHVSARGLKQCCSPIIRALGVCILSECLITRDRHGALSSGITLLVDRRHGALSSGIIAFKFMMYNKEIDKQRGKWEVEREKVR